MYVYTRLVSTHADKATSPRDPHTSTLSRPHQTTISLTEFIDGLNLPSHGSLLESLSDLYTLARYDDGVSAFRGVFILSVVVMLVLKSGIWDR